MAMHCFIFEAFENFFIFIVCFLIFLFIQPM